MADHKRVPRLDKKKKKRTLNPKNKNDKCFQYAATIILNYGEIKWNQERVSNIKMFINKYYWDGIKYPSEIDNSKTSAKNNPTIAHDSLYTWEMKLYSAYISKINFKLWKKVYFNDPKRIKRGLSLSWIKKNYLQ